MGTRAMIAVKVGEVYRTIYTHWDGYPGHHFPILSEHYGHQKVAELLVSFGDASTLGEVCVPNGAHSYDRPERGCTVYYGRDRGEDNTGPRDYADISGIPLEEYLYVFENGLWRWSTDGHRWHFTATDEADDS